MKTWQATAGQRSAVGLDPSRRRRVVRSPCTGRQVVMTAAAVGREERRAEAGEPPSVASPGFDWRRHTGRRRQRRSRQARHGPRHADVRPQRPVRSGKTRDEHRRSCAQAPRAPADSAPGYTDSARAGRAECPGQRRSAPAPPERVPRRRGPVDDLSGAVSVPGTRRARREPEPRRRRLSQRCAPATRSDRHRGRPRACALQTRS